MSRKFIAICAIMICFLMPLISISSAYEKDSNWLYVGGLGNGNYSSIQSAIDDSSIDDVVYVYNGIYNENIFIDKSINLIGENQDTTIIDGNNKGIVIGVISGGVNISGFTIRGSGVPLSPGKGTHINESAYINVSNYNGSVDKENFTLDIDLYKSWSGNVHETFSNINYTGILVNSDFNTITSCNIEKCHIAIIFKNSSYSNIEESEIFDNSGAITFYESSNCKIINCSIFSNEYGISLQKSNFSTIFNSTISSNNGTGLSLGESSSSNIYHNVILNNVIGITLNNHCENNVFYKNNFIGNEISNAIDNCNNSWDNGAIGNYWDDYAGIDGDSDGIGDQYHNITLISEDKYPSIEPFVSLDLNNPIVISIDSPQHNDVVNGSIIISGKAECDIEIKSVKVEIDGGELLTADGKTNWQVEWDTTLYENGSHDLYVYVLNENDDYAVKNIVVTVRNEAESNKPTTSTPGFEFLLFISLLIFFIVSIKIKKGKKG